MVIVFFSRQNSKAFLSWNKIYFAWGLECIFLHIVYWQKWTTCKYVQCIFQKLLIVLCIGSKMVPALLMLTFASQWPPPWPGPRLAGCWWLGYVTSSTHVWHGNCTATGTWTPPCARHGVSQYLKCAPCIPQPNPWMDNKWTFWSDFAATGGQ